MTLANEGKGSAMDAAFQAGRQSLPLTTAEAERSERARAAAAWLAEHAPDLDDGHGRVCPFAVATALRLRREGRVTVGLVRAERAAWMRRQGLGEFVGVNIERED